MSAVGGGDREGSLERCQRTRSHCPLTGGVTSDMTASFLGLRFLLYRGWRLGWFFKGPHLRIPDRGLVISWVSGGHFRLEIPQKTSGHCTRIGCHCPSHVLEHSREALPFPCSKIGQIQFISCARDTLTHQHLQFTRQVALRPLELYKHPRRWGTLSALRPFYRSGISG